MHKFSILARAALRTILKSLPGRHYAQLLNLGEGVTMSSFKLLQGRHYVHILNLCKGFTMHMLQFLQGRHYAQVLAS